MRVAVGMVPFARRATLTPIRPATASPPASLPRSSLPDLHLFRHRGLDRVAASHLRYLADADYFIEQMSSHAEYGGALYTQLEFAYGPLLGPTILLHAALHCSWMTAYFLTLALDQSIGLGLLAYVPTNCRSVAATAASALCCSQSAR